MFSSFMEISCRHVSSFRLFIHRSGTDGQCTENINHFMLYNWRKYKITIIQLLWKKNHLNVCNIYAEALHQPFFFKSMHLSEPKLIIFSIFSTKHLRNIPCSLLSMEFFVSPVGIPETTHLKLVFYNYFEELGQQQQPTDRPTDQPTDQHQTNKHIVSTNKQTQRQIPCINPSMQPCIPTTMFHYHSVWGSS